MDTVDKVIAFVVISFFLIFIIALFISGQLDDMREKECIVALVEAGIPASETALVCNN
jgi:hypothetical protein